VYTLMDEWSRGRKKVKLKKSGEKAGIQNNNMKIIETCN